MSGKRYTEEFKAGAVKQVLERGHSMVDVAGRLSINKRSLYAWFRRAKQATPATSAASGGRAAPEPCCLRAELKRVTEGLDIL